MEKGKRRVKNSQKGVEMREWKGESGEKRVESGEFQIESRGRKVLFKQYFAKYNKL